MRLYIAGHNHRRGYAIAREWSDAECSRLPAADADDMQPVRFVIDRDKAFHLVARWNRRFATH
ncbi:hypothetical protein [Burkholderia sp. BE12]|uniref:hypothetical protein n=1 Tax=Burkholderia sp. BE12 TaxID=2082394 RepID=UPI001319F5B6|nr:hypothetical protein [Burkholderia sp. BE12]